MEFLFPYVLVIFGHLVCEIGRLIVQLLLHLVFICFRVLQYLNIHFIIILVVHE